MKLWIKQWEVCTAYQTYLVRDRRLIVWLPGINGEAVVPLKDNPLEMAELINLWHANARRETAIEGWVEEVWW